MKTQTIKKTRDIIAIKNDISRIRSLIENREKWLNDPVNRMRSTYMAVHKDTMQLLEQLQELEDELDYATKH
jgi:hypothetical protein